MTIQDKQHKDNERKDKNNKKHKKPRKQHKRQETARLDTKIKQQNKKRKE